MKKIPLTRGKVALVDDEDFVTLSQSKWWALKGRNTWYAVREIGGRKAKKSIRMHRQILGLVFGDGVLVDHRDLNGLNNQRHNLRICTNSQNCGNQRLRILKLKRSQYKGVAANCVPRDTRPWRASITVHGKNRWLGNFYTEEAAALAYNEAAKLYFGEFARLNVVGESSDRRTLQPTT